MEELNCTLNYTILIALSLRGEDEIAKCSRAAGGSDHLTMSLTPDSMAHMNTRDDKLKFC
jgi:hypothetical protein